MRIYEFHNADNQAYVYAPEDVAAACLPDPPRSLAAGWSPPCFELVHDDEYRRDLPKSDFLTFAMVVMVLSDRAVERLAPILKGCGETLPIQLSDVPDRYYLFNVTRLIDAIDMKKSKFMRFPDGRIMKVERLIFDPAKEPVGAVFFKTTQLGPVTEIFATESAVRVVNDADLTGHDFRLVWSDD
jgi:hypothetical protein